MYKMVNYPLGKIYKIISNSTNKIYIGSTTKKYLTSRLVEHIRDYKKYIDGKHYISSFELIKNNDYQIILIEKYPCNNKNELNAREQYYIDLYKNLNVNKNNAFGTNKEKHKSSRKTTGKKYRNDNKEKIKQCNLKYYISNKEKFKQYRLEYYISNKEKIRENRSQDVICHICAGKYSKSHKNRHIKTINHKQFTDINNKIKETAELYKKINFEFELLYNTINK